MEKQRVRQEYILKRRQVSLDDAASKSEIIREKLETSIDWQMIHSAHIYQSQAAINEVDTSQIIEYIRTQWPQIELTVGDPSPTAPLPLSKYDLIVVPIVAFDTQRNRLGFGGGWYDRFLATQPQAMTVGLAYDFQQRTALPAEQHDVRLSKIITEAKVLEDIDKKP